MQQQIEKFKDIIIMICSTIVKDDNIKKVVESQLQEINNKAINEENNKEIITDQKTVNKKNRKSRVQI